MWACEREATSSSVTSESEIRRLVHTTVDLATNVDMRETCEDEHGHAKMNPCAEYIRQVIFQKRVPLCILRCTRA